ncbi:HEAT repeat domain-containing protein [Maricaulis alexandrii]|uniref:hypothetical protein n=1 Tax=Maricaulis alexandrii TaxID=2570354 RepID=UPI0011097BC3|nr:hypothetical protein [Maricaulis alexandrii]
MIEEDETQSDLIDTIIRHEGDIGPLLNDVRPMLGKSIPFQRLLDLLNSANPEHQIGGAWILAESPRVAIALKSHVKDLLGSDIREVRFFGMDAFLDVASSADKETVGAALLLLADSDDWVRWNALRRIHQLKARGGVDLLSSEPMVAGCGSGHTRLANLISVAKPSPNMVERLSEMLFYESPACLAEPSRSNFNQTLSLSAAAKDFLMELDQ